MIWEGYKNLIYFYHYYYFFTVCKSCSLSSWRAASVGAGTLRLVRACWITSGTSMTLQALFCHVGLQDVQLSFSCFVEKHICDFIPSLTMLDYKISNSLSVALWRCTSVTSFPLLPCWITKYPTLFQLLCGDAHL